MKVVFLSIAAVLLAGGVASVRGQSALDGFDPNANGSVFVVDVQSDGKILIGGDFSTIGGVIRHRIARLNPDGTLDAAFDPNANGVVRSITVQADGKILAGGDFTTIGGQPRNRIARLDAITGLADSFNPNANAQVISIAVQADGKILVGGVFDAFFGTPTIGGQTRNDIARLDPITGLADSFNPNADGDVYSITVQADGKILVGGVFASIGGQTRNRIARLHATTGLADSFDPNASNSVHSIAVQVDGKILAGGDFTTVGGQPRNHIARLDAATGLPDSFNPNANGVVRSIAVQADGKILASGIFESIGGQNRVDIARLDATTGLADSFDPNPGGPAVESIAVQADGKILAGGGFTTIGGKTRNHIARLERDGRVDQTLNVSVVAPIGLGGLIKSLAYQPDGKILIGGTFSSVASVARNNIARLNTDGTLDMGFDPNANVGAEVDSIAVQPDGKILVGGFFTSIGGQTRHYIARLDAATGLPDSFDPRANLAVDSIAIQADGKILIGGTFTFIGGQQRLHIARLDGMTGSVDSFNPSANNDVLSIAVQADNKIVVGGLFFGTFGGQTRHHIARIDPTTGLADEFNPNAVSSIDAITVQTDGKVLVGGDFTFIGGQPRNGIARLDATMGLVDSFDPNAQGDSGELVASIAVQTNGKVLTSGSFQAIGGEMRNRIARLEPVMGLADSFDPNADSNVFSIAVQTDGKILAGGDFQTIGGQARTFFARLVNDTAALQNVAVTKGTVTWTLSGSTPQFTRVTFEYSTDNVNYSPLGSGTVAGSGWTLMGLNLPTGQNFYIRARGYYRSGYFNGSESITETVRNAFIIVPGISGTITHCPLLRTVPNVTLNLTGDTTASTLSDALGNYMFSSLVSGGNYTVTATKANLPPGSAGINTLDVIVTQQHFLAIGTSFTECQLISADVNGDNAVNTIDVIAIQRFFLSYETGTANVGKHEFIPTSRSYPGIAIDEIDENYDTIIFGDVAFPFAD